MKRTALPVSRELKSAAERQMRSWALGLEAKAKRLEKADLSKQVIHPYVAISREAGIEAGQIASLIAAKTKWNVLDKDLVDRLAEERHWSRMAVELVDERMASWFNEILGKWIDPGAVSQLDYVHAMARVVLLAAHS